MSTLKIEHITNIGRSGEDLSIDTDGNIGIAMTPDSAVKLSVTGAIGPTNGTDAAPTHTFYSDPDTGMYRSGANALSFSTGGSNALTLNSSQNANFAGTITGSSSITATTTINVGTGGGFYLKQDNSESTIRSESQPIILQTYASSAWQDRLTVTNAGNIGIGTTGPAYALAVEKDVNDWVSRIYNTGQDANAYGLLVRTDATAAHNPVAFGVYADSTYKVKVYADGKFGIGHADPNALFHVQQPATAGNNYDEGIIKVGGTSSTLGFAIQYTAQGSGRANVVGLNPSGGQNNRISLGFGAIQSYGEPATRVLTVDQGNYVHHTPPGNARFMPMISPQSVTRHGAYPTHPGGDAIGNNQTNSTQIGFAHVYQRNWSAGRYIHMKTNIPNTGSNYGMVMVFAKGYRYSPGGTIDSSWAFHNWGTAVYSLDQRNYATTFAVNAYVSSDSYVVLVGDNQSSGSTTYTGFRLDFMYANTNYPAHTQTQNGESHYLIATSLSSSTSGVY